MSSIYTLFYFFVIFRNTLKGYVNLKSWIELEFPCFYPLDYYFRADVFIFYFCIIMAIKKTVAKATPTVTVETKKISSEKNACCAFSSGRHMIKIVVLALTVLNTILLISLLSNQDRNEALKVGGNENYKLLKQIFTTDSYKSQQRQQIEQAMEMFSNPAAAQAPAGQQQAPAIQQQAPAAQ